MSEHIDDLSAEFVEMVQLDIDTGTLSTFTRLMLLAGPPVGVDVYNPLVAGVCHDAAVTFKVTALHADWQPLWDEVLGGRQ